MHIFTANTSKTGIGVIVCFFLTFFSFAPTLAQTTHRSRAAIKAETRKSKRDAAKFEADYKESHLNTAHYTFKKGKAGRKTVPVSDVPADYISDKEINELDREELKKMSKKKLQPKQKKNKKITTI